MKIQTTTPFLSETPPIPDLPYFPLVCFAQFNKFDVVYIPKASSEDRILRRVHPARRVSVARPMAIRLKTIAEAAPKQQSLILKSSNVLQARAS
jgi:hypothetical protein